MMGTLGSYESLKEQSSQVISLQPLNIVHLWKEAISLGGQETLIHVVLTHIASNFFFLIMHLWYIEMEAL